MEMKIIVIFSVVGMFVLASGCVETPEAKKAVTEIRIGDMPTDDFDHIWVNFTEIRLHRSGNDSGWITIEVNKTIDLLYLHINNLNETLGIVEIDIGNYTKLWINVSNASGLLNMTQKVINFTIPSGWLKIQQLFKLQEGTNTITVDIDLNNSILRYGGGEEYKLLPVISRLEHRYENNVQFREHDSNKLKNLMENRPPIIDVVANGSRGKPIFIYVGENITFNASGTYDFEGENVTYYWDFGDGTNASGPIVNHSYENKGSYWVELTVTDGELDATEKIHVNVKE